MDERGLGGTWFSLMQELPLLKLLWKSQKNEKYEIYKLPFEITRKFLTPIIAIGNNIIKLWAISKKLFKYQWYVLKTAW